ncbi:MAG: hypothetical protein WC081_06210 [Candidatus Ratteibacteria bacterium]|jgi:hypothetical protein
MMKKRLLSIILTGTIVFVVAFVITQRFLTLNRDILPKNQVNALLVCNPVLYGNQPGITEAYDKVLEEEGVPHKVVTPHALLSLDSAQILEANPVIIIPDGVAQSLPSDFVQWCKNYLASGGSMMVVYDGGTRNKKGAFLKEALFADFLGVNYLPYERLRGQTYTRGYIQFKNSASADFFQMPTGVLDADNFLLGYQYGKLEYPIVRAEPLGDVPAEDIYAYALTKEQERYPALVLKKKAAGSGSLLYVNFPLGYLKAYTNNDLLLRTILRTFLFKVVKIPHLLNTPSGKGGLVINWHIDSNNEWLGIPFMEKHRFLRKDLEYSIHVTAGDFCDEPGDGRGFDASGRGRPYLETLAKYGTIGSHGGWAHNWFAKNLQERKISPEGQEEYIRRNDESLQNVIGYKIIEYSAPVGVHLQPITTNILEKLGFVAYYYTGDLGSAPNRTFVNGKMVSDKVIAFPVMPYRKFASIDEMERAGITPEEVKKWWCDTLDYTVRNRTVRLIYSHPYDLYNIPKYSPALDAFLNYAEKEQNNGKVRVKPMSYFAKFMLKFLKTRYVFNLQESGLAVNIQNSDGLNEITLAIPKDRYQKPEGSEFILDQDNDYYYLTCAGNLRKKNFQVSQLHPVLRIWQEFQKVEENNYIIPYFVTLKAIADLNDGKIDIVKNYIIWHLNHLNYPDKNGLNGTIYDYRISQDGREVSTKDYDSVDSYAGMFLYLVNRYYQKTNDKQFIEKNRAKLEDIARVIVWMQDVDGLIMVMPGNNTKYLMDNCESYGGIKAFMSLSRAMNWETKDFEKTESALRNGIRKFFDSGKNNFYWAIQEEKKHASTWDNYYPDAYAQLFPVLFGLLEEDTVLRTSLWKNFNQFQASKIDKMAPEQKIIFEFTKEVMSK